MSWEKSEVMSEFLKIAGEQDWHGLKKTAAPEPNPYQEDIKTIEEKRQKSPEKHIMEIAHPDPVYVAEARGDGGLVENEIEKQRRAIEIINKHPMGQHLGRYASAVVELVKLAEVCDQLGYTFAADRVTDAAQELVNTLEEDNFPLE